MVVTRHHTVSVFGVLVSSSHITKCILPRMYMMQPPPFMSSLSFLTKLYPSMFSSVFVCPCFGYAYYIRVFLTCNTLQFIQFVHNTSSIYRYNFMFVYSDVTSAPFFLIFIHFIHFVQIFVSLYKSVLVPTFLPVLWTGFPL